MSAFVFVGPTLSVAAARAELDATYLPPVSQGDVYRVARLKPKAIGIIDGFFQRVPTVWHKEVLWALEQGIHVFGSASMGALRAAELAQFGMEGVGVIFEAYASGALIDDDEVAVTHGPAGSGYAALSEAMVSIRATLAAAEAGGVITARIREILERLAKGLFYPDRVYPRILREAAELGVPAPELHAFRLWLPQGRVDVKRDDAVRMLRRMREFLALGSSPQPAAVRMERTLQWQRATRFVDQARAPETGTAAVGLGDLLDELGLHGDAYVNVYQMTLLRHLAIMEARSRGYESRAAEVEQMRSHFLQSQGLNRPADIDQWLQENQLARAQLDALMADEVVRARLFQELEPEVVSEIPNQLRLVGAYGPLMARARAKQRALEERGLHDAGLTEAGLSLDDLVQWHFGRLRQTPPEDLDGYARSHGFGSVDGLARALVREFLYLRVPPARAPSAGSFGELARSALSALMPDATT